MRTEEQIADLESQVFQWDWKVPHGSPVGMLSYAMVQELATGLTYRNLKRHVGTTEDPALAKMLGYLGVDEQAHHRFFQSAVRLFLESDRDETLRGCVACCTISPCRRFTKWPTAEGVLRRSNPFNFSTIAST